MPYLYLTNIKELKTFRGWENAKNIYCGQAFHTKITNSNPPFLLALPKTYKNNNLCSVGVVLELDNLQMNVAYSLLGLYYGDSTKIVKMEISLQPIPNSMEDITDKFVDYNKGHKIKAYTFVLVNQKIFNRHGGKFKDEWRTIRSCIVDKRLLREVFFSSE